MTREQPKKRTSPDPYHTSQERCIWMTAGVVSYKLCPFQYDCEHCEFDEVMRHQFTQRGSPKTGIDLKKRSFVSTKALTEDPFFTFSIDELPEECYFHLTHVWGRPRENDTWEMGIDQLLSYILPPPIGFEVFADKRNLVQNEVLGRIITTGGSVFLITPLSGSFIRMNPEVSKQPQLMQEDPLGKGWLAQFRWSRDRSELREFYTGAEARRFLQEEACHLRHVLKYRGVEIGQTGTTLRDGGKNFKHLHQILPLKLCAELSRILIALGKAI
jgi:glycine cleavage system H protein